MISKVNIEAFKAEMRQQIKDTGSLVNRKPVVKVNSFHVKAFAVCDELLALRRKENERLERVQSMANRLVAGPNSICWTLTELEIDEIEKGMKYTLSAERIREIIASVFPLNQVPQDVIEQFQTYKCFDKKRYEAKVALIGRVKELLLKKLKGKV